MPVTHRNSVAFTVIVAVAVVLCSIPLLLVILLSGAPTTMVLAVILAALPVGPVLAAFMWLDRYEPEPRSLLVAGLLWGALVATGAALVINGIGGFFVGFDSPITVAVVAPFAEEATKGFFLLMLLWWRRHELDGILDGIVYAGMVGIGFAFTENILYLAAAYDGTDGLGPGGVEGVTTVFVIRCLFSPFAHPFFTAAIGIGVGLAVTTRSPLVRWTAPVIGYFFAVLGHALWNGSTFVAEGVGFILTYFLVMVPGFVVLTGFAIWLRSSEKRLLHDSLHDAAARGLLPAEEIPHLVDLRHRRASRRHANQYGGAGARQAMQDYQQAAIELGFLHHRYLRGTAPHDFASRGRAHVAQMQAARPHISFPFQVVP
ncbi:PrsW family intramembrane metalloprotease [Nocardioides limicola]|uniref:PrsW family intramembrane metalloprotease n=1 Tax=Nocardioides limicola TaxID=2803368 RepID=UPI00193B4E1E|nr:PrsW family intramembrane metalloprotease [Nocardioides sp. DJM-14]